MNKIFVATLILSSLVSVKALTCWVCENVNSNSECISTGRAKRCQANELACQISVRRGSFGILITKRCKQAEACDNNFIQNPRAAWQPSQCNTQVPSSVCRCCCNTDLCNRDTLECTQGDDQGCPRIGVPGNGTSSCDPLSDNRERISTLGTVCTFRCNTGFRLEGRVTSTCLETLRQNQNVAEFNNPVPRCVPATCDPPRTDPDNGSVRCTNRNNVNSVCTYTCNAGFARSGSRTTRCGRNNQWTQPPPSCEPVICLPRHTDPTNGQVTCTNENNYNSVCRFSCDSGYFLGGVDQSRCTDDGDGDVDGVWSANAPTCVRITCIPERRAPGNGSVSCSNGINIGSICGFDCDSGYFLNGDSTTTCQDDGDGDAQGVWSNPNPSCDPIVCNPPHSRPTNGRVSCTNINNLGSECSFTCNSGFFLNGASRSTCVDDNDGDADGVWNEPAPTCIQITCDPERIAPGNGSVSCSDGNNFGSICGFDCDSGYFLNGESITTCQDDGDGDEQGVWSNLNPSCDPIVCNPPHSRPTNGRVQCTDFNNLGSECSFTCNSGFFLNGASRSTCVDDNDSDADGVWDEPAPTCIQITCDPERIAPGNGSVSCSDSNNFGSICGFDCDSGYFLNGDSTTTCQDDGDGDEQGVWSNPNPSCDPIVCNPPHSRPTNGRVQCSDFNNLGSECSFTCNSGFFLNGALQSTCVDDNDGDADGVWNEPAPTCTQIICNPERIAPGNGSVSCSDGNNFGSICGFDCDSGYFLNGDSTTTCQDDGDGDEQGVWSNPNPVCDPIFCNPPHSRPTNGRVRCTDLNNLGSECSFTCNPGFILNGASQSTCVDDNDGDADGVWNELAPTCAQITCNPERIAPGNGSVSCSDGNNFGSICGFDCDSGYFLNGEPTATCQDDGDGDAQGVWSNPNPVCDPIVCNPPQTRPDNGRVICTDFNNLGSECRFRCNNNFALIGSDISACNDNNDGDALGEWSSDAPVCQRITCQPRYTEIGNGSVSCTNENFVGSICSFSCISGNFALLGNPFLTCDPPADGGVTGRWSFPAPTCILKRCGPPPAAPENGGIVCPRGNVLGSQCEFTCNEYHTRVGPLYTTCVEDGLNDIRFWNNSAPTCQPNRCPQQTLPHGSVTCDDQELDATTTCGFECVDPDYQLYPPNLTENRCLNDTTWNISRPCCTRPCPPYANMDFVIVLDSSSSIGNTNWVTVKNFTRNIINTFNVGPDSARIGVFRYNKEIDTATQILLNSHPTNKTAILEAFDAIPYNGSGTFTGKALQHARDVLFAPGNGNRPDVRDVMLIITDGRAQDSDVVVEAARDLQRDGVLVFVLGIVPPRGALDTDELDRIAGNPDNVIIAEQGFQGLDDQLITSISTQICGDPCLADPRPN